MKIQIKKCEDETGKEKGNCKGYIPGYSFCDCDTEDYIDCDWNINKGRTESYLESRNMKITCPDCRVDYIPIPFSFSKQNHCMCDFEKADIFDIFVNELFSSDFQHIF
jgi:hypothetical protein